MNPRDLPHTAAPGSTPTPAGHPEPAQELRRLVNAVIWPGFVGTTVPAWLERALRNGLAGAVYFAHNLDPTTPGQLPALSAAIRAANPQAVIGVDEEGGSVTRLEAGAGSSVPGAAVLGALNEPALTEAAGRALGRLCRAAGVNLTIAPVADVNTNPRNPVIGVRAFGATTALVSTHTAAAVTGIQALRVGACAKHFPGHGDTVADSHLDVARVTLSLQELREAHLPPFHAAVEAQVAAVMSAHIIIDELGPAPATLNPRAGSLLRELGHTGLLITDALDMAAVRATVGAGEGAVLSLLAGADLLCVGNPLNAYTSGRDDESCYEEIVAALTTAVTDGRLPREVLRVAGDRVAAFARWAGQEPAADAWALADATLDWVAITARAAIVEDGAAGHRVATLSPAAAAVTVVDARAGHNMAAGPTANFLAVALGRDHAVTVLPADAVPAEPGAWAATPVLLLLDALRDPRQQAVVTRLAAVAPHAVCINVGLAPDPGVPRPAPSLATVHVHGFSRVGANAVVALLHGA